MGLPWIARHLLLVFIFKHGRAYSRIRRPRATHDRCEAGAVKLCSYYDSDVRLCCTWYVVTSNIKTPNERRRLSCLRLLAYGYPKPGCVPISRRSGRRYEPGGRGQVQALRGKMRGICKRRWFGFLHMCTFRFEMRMYNWCLGSLVATAGGGAAAAAADGQHSRQHAVLLFVI